MNKKLGWLIDKSLVPPPAPFPSLYHPGFCPSLQTSKGQPWPEWSRAGPTTHHNTAGRPGRAKHFYHILPTTITSLTHLTSWYTSHHYISNSSVPQTRHKPLKKTRLPFVSSMLYYRLNFEFIISFVRSYTSKTPGKEDKTHSILPPAPNIIFTYELAQTQNGILHRDYCFLMRLGKATGDYNCNKARSFSNREAA